MNGNGFKPPDKNQPPVPTMMACGLCGESWKIKSPAEPYSHTCDPDTLLKNKFKTSLLAWTRRYMNGAAEDMLEHYKEGRTYAFINMRIEMNRTGVPPSYFPEKFKVTEGE